MNDTTQTLLRSLLKLGSGYLLAKGVADESTVNVIAAGLFAVVGVIWGVTHRRSTAPQSVPVKVGPLLVLLAAAGLLAGCQGTPARIAFNTVKVPAVTLDAVMTAYGDYYRQFGVATADQVKVRAAYEKAKAAELLAIDAAQAAVATLWSTNSVLTLQQQLTGQAAQQALADLLSLVRALGVKI
jgi:hypothetical protein